MKVRASTVLTWFSVAGVGATGYLSAKAGEKAARIKAELEEYSLDTPDKKRVLKRVLPTYIWAFLSGSLTVVSIITARHLDSKDLAKMAAALGLATTQLETVKKNMEAYMQEVRNTVGPEKEAEIRQKAAEKVIKNKETGMEEGIYTWHIDWLGEDLYFDATLSQYHEAVIGINRKMIDYNWLPDCGYATVNDFFEFMGHPELKSKDGERAGWEAEMLSVDYACMWIDFFDPKPMLDPNGKTCYDIRPLWLPWEDFMGAAQLYYDNEEELLRQHMKTEEHEDLPFN